MTFVQLHENELEQKRLHCKASNVLWSSSSLTLHNLDIKVVEAFKSALDLLRN